MVLAVDDRVLRRIADVIDAGANSPPVQGRLAPAVLEALARLVPCDCVTFLELEPVSGGVYAEDEVLAGEVRYLPEPVFDPTAAFWRHYAGSAFCNYPTRTGDHRSVVLRSDVCSTREWKQSPLYIDALANGMFDFEMLCPLPSGSGRSRRLLFSRSGSRDFTESDRFALALLRPHLAEMVARRREPASSSLTERQTELMRLVVDGCTNAQIATALHLSPHTVRAHLTNIFDRLGVSTRAAAVAQVLSG